MNEIMVKVGQYLFAKRRTIMTLTGVGLQLGGTGLACYRMRKVNRIVDDAKTDLANIKRAAEEYKEDPDSYEEAYGDEEVKDDKKKVYKGATLAIAKEMALPASMIIGGTGLVLGSHFDAMSQIKHDTKAIAALTTSCTALAAVNDRLKKNAIETLGEEAYEELRYGTETKEIEVPWDENDEGHDPNEVKTETKTVLADPDGSTGFEIKFGPGHDFYRGDPTLDINYIKVQETLVNELLAIRRDKSSKKRWVSMNEIYDIFAVPRGGEKCQLNGFHADDVIVDEDGCLIDQFVVEVHRARDGKSYILDFPGAGPLFR